MSDEGDAGGEYPTTPGGRDGLGGAEETQVTGAYARQTPVPGTESLTSPLAGGGEVAGADDSGLPPASFEPPKRSKGLIASVIVLAILLVASLCANAYLLATRKSEVPATTIPTTTTPSPTPSVSPTATASPSPSPTPTKSATGTPTGGSSPKDASTKLYSARKANNKTTAAQVATSGAIDQLWAKSAGSYTLNGCESDPNDPANPDKGACTFVQPGGQLSMYAQAESGKWKVVSVVFEPIATG